MHNSDGNRVLQIQISGTQVITTAYAGAIEVQITATQRITKAYYSAGGQLIALRVYTAPTNGVLYYLHSDHLGSTSLTTDSSGHVVARQMYDAWGQVRLRGDLQTDIGYTGQREDVGINAMFYRARFYSPALGRFLSADTIVPEAGNPQAFNRYSYTRNNPVKYVDPSGHCGVSQKSGQEAEQEIAECKAILGNLQSEYGLAEIYYPPDQYFDESGVRQWYVREARALREALEAWSVALGGEAAATKLLGLKGMTIRLITNNQMVKLAGKDVGGFYEEGSNAIYLAMRGSADNVTFAHELAHAFSSRRNSLGQRQVNLFSGHAPLNTNDWGYGALFGKYDYFGRTWIPDGGGWTDYARGDGDFAPALPYEDFAETAAHSVLHTAKVIPHSARYAYMLALMPGLSQR